MCGRDQIRDETSDQRRLSRPAAFPAKRRFEICATCCDGSGHLRRGRPGLKPGDRAWQEVGLLRTFEHGVATDSAPTAAQVIVDGDEFEGGATVWAGE